MVDKQRINFIIEDIEMYLRKLNDRKITKISELDDLNFYACSMILFSIINRTIDLGDQIVKDKELGYPLAIKDIFTFLSDSKIIDKKLAESLKELVIARNKFSHRYGAIKKEDILKLIKDMIFVRAFIKEIIDAVKNEKS